MAGQKDKRTQKVKSDEHRDTSLLRPMNDHQKEYIEAIKKAVYYGKELDVVNLKEEAGNNPQVVKHQERIAQMIIKQHETVEFVEVNDLDETVRGENGFGSSGKD